MLSKMCSIRTSTTTAILQRIALPAFRTVSIPLPLPLPLPNPIHLLTPVPLFQRSISYVGIRCAASPSSQHGDAAKKGSARLTQLQQLMSQSEERAKAAASEGSTPQITLDHVTLSFARSGGPGGQHVNKVNTKVDMRFNVRNALWLSERIRDKILQLEKNRINKEGELIISSTKSRTQQGNIQDCLTKLQTIIDAAAYVPPPPSEEQKKRVAKLAAKSEQNRILTKKVNSQKKEFRRNKGSWD